MDIGETWHGTNAVLSFPVPGDLDGRSGPRLREMIDQVLDEGAEAVIVDLWQVPFVDSAGLGALIGGLKASRRRGRNFALAAPCEEVRQILDVTNLRRVFDVHETVEEALVPPPAPAVTGQPAVWAE
jgi:anti-anti-sigma factor